MIALCGKNGLGLSSTHLVTPVIITGVSIIGTNHLNVADDYPVGEGKRKEEKEKDPVLT